MSNIQSNIKSQVPNRKFDLGERTLEFSKKVLNFAKDINNNTITNPVINQLIRSATSIGANYMEASEANSKRDFINKIVIAKKEAKEVRYWLKLVIHICPNFKDRAIVLWQEARELNLILAAIVNKMNTNKN